MNKRRVVITGIGAITPVGHNVTQTWESLVNGVSGVDLISKFDYIFQQFNLLPFLSVLS